MKGSASLREQLLEDVEAVQTDGDPKGLETVERDAVGQNSFLSPRDPTSSRNESPEEGELREDDSTEVNPVLATELPDAAEDEALDDDDVERAKRKKKRKKEKKEKKEEKAKWKKQKGGNSMMVEIVDGAAEESMVMRKLLRGPRYFDPPEELGQSCFNCGKVGHIAVACPDGPRLKPCYVCGGFGHEGRVCPQKTECYVCGEVGHIAKFCPNKGSITMRVSVAGNGDLCLLCGHHGHEASSCYNSYDAEDLAQVQCYVCNGFGHLSCVVIVDSSPLPVSCYDCGEMGHTGAGCARPRRNDRERNRGTGTASVCFKCGEEGHYARGCSKQNAPWPGPWPTDDTPPQGGSARREGRFTPRSTGESRWMDLQQREPRWTPARRSSAAFGDQWNGSPAGGGRGGRGADVSPAVDEDTDSYMGPIENFATTQKDGYRKRRKRSWTSTSAR